MVQITIGQLFEVDEKIWTQRTYVCLNNMFGYEVFNFF